MMKRVLAVALAAAFFTVATATAWAYPVLVSSEVKFRTHKATAATGEVLLDSWTGAAACVACAVDSTATHRVGTQISVLDTTVAISMEGWSLPPMPIAAATDSTVFCQFTISDATGTACETGMDSLYVGAQVSMDGQNWVTVMTFKGGTPSSITSRLSQANVTGTLIGALSLNGASLARGAPVWKIVYKTKTLTGLDSQDQFGLPGWKMIRWIVGFPDAGGYGVKAHVTRYVEQQDRY
jgi:hypothetical protein